MTCAYCGSSDHTVGHCPWQTRRATMKRCLITIGLLLCLSGCAGLKTTWVLEMQYSTPDEKK